VADYAEVPSFVDQIARAAIDAHMREFAANFGNRWLGDHVSLTQQDNNYVLYDFNWSQTIVGPVTIMGPDAAGWGGGTPSAQIADPLNPSSYPNLMQAMNQVMEFQNIREMVRQAAMEGNGAHYWGGLPDPSLFGDTFTALDQAATVLDVRRNEGIGWHIARIQSILDGTVNPDGSPRSTPQPMNGDIAEALREMLCGFKTAEDQSSDLTTSSLGSLPRFCLSGHDLVIALKYGAQVEQQIWQAARTDVATVTQDAIATFSSWQPSAPAANLAPLADGLALASVGLADIPGGQGVAVGLGIVAGLIQLVIDFTPPTTPNEATSVDGLLRAFVLALNGGMQGWDYDGSIFNAIKTLETQINQYFVDRQRYSDGWDRNGKSFAFDPNRFKPMSESQGQWLNMPGLQVIASQHIPAIVELLQSVNDTITSVLNPPIDSAWKRALDLGFSDDQTGTGARTEWGAFAEGILGLIGPNGSESAIQQLESLASNILASRNDIAQCDADEASACDRIAAQWWQR